MGGLGYNGRVKLMDVIQVARPKGWVKNGIVLLPVLFAERMTDLGAWMAALAAAAAFCFASSGVYILNDFRDRHSDRLHPRKRNRPLAAGRVPAPFALAEAGALGLAGLAVAFATGPLVLLFVLAYLLLQVAYTFYFKRRMLLDVMCIALGFVLRASAGAVAIQALISPWLVICTFTLCLFLGFCKRYNESVTLGNSDHAVLHRPTLGAYTPELLTHLITLSAAIAILAFLIYATSERTVSEFGTYWLAYTLPLFIYGVCRFAMLSMMGRFTDPTELFLHDRPFQATILLWVACVIAIIAYGPGMREWMKAIL